MCVVRCAGPAGMDIGRPGRGVTFDHSSGHIHPAAGVVSFIDGACQCKRHPVVVWNRIIQEELSDQRH